MPFLMNSGAMTPVHLPISTRVSAMANRVFSPFALERSTRRTRSAIELQKLNFTPVGMTAAGAVHSSGRHRNRAAKPQMSPFNP